ncbi:MAG: 6-phospho-beta-glucosidase [Spirochaetaceae bacterium]|jgi:6-phospho-beta-glucosidase|nr:6-phospho-beta-glucosidase [Spirochaetaceae bacterium]
MGLKICTIGGGSSYTPELVDGFIRRAASLPVSDLWLVDIEAGQKKLEIVGNLARRMVKRAGIPMNIHLTLNLDQALDGADFVTTQIRVGFLDAREKDETIPLKHGLLGQETNGAGGLFKALRTIPVILGIAEKIKARCPGAFLVNFTNPSGMVAEALSRYGPLPKNRFAGLCNVPIHMEKAVAKILGVEDERLRIDFAGLNHMVYGLKIYIDGKDVSAEAIEKIAGLDGAENGLSVKNILAVEYSKEFARALGVLVCPYHNYYYHSDKMLEEELAEYKAGNIRAQKVKRIEKALFETYANETLDTKPAELEERGGAFYSDAACRLINSLYNDLRDIQPVDVVNSGAIAGIDNDSVVEASSVIFRSGPRPLNVGALPTAVNGLVQQIKSFERLCVEAAVEGSYEKAVLALAINPLTPNESVAKKVVDELLLAHKEYLPRFFR